MINHIFGIDKPFQEILHRTDNWINEWINLGRDTKSDWGRVRKKFRHCHVLIY